MVGITQRAYIGSIQRYIFSIFQSGKSNSFQLGINKENTPFYLWVYLRWCCRVWGNETNAEENFHGSTGAMLYADK